ncbi:MAG: M56 family metallopeptidase [Oscillospiraceae bacterium]|nr:M56 family metallopeptidase [Oscillospiraceae bacterium]
MLSEIFYWLFSMSVSASIAGIIVLLSGKISRLPRRLYCFLWIIPFVRMWIPVGMNSRYSLMTLLTRLSKKIMVKNVVIYKSENDLSMSMMNHVGAAKTYFPVTYEIDLLEDIFRMASILWLAVAAVLLLFVIVGYVITITELKKARHLRGNIYISSALTAPAAYGILRGKIVLPEGCPEDDLTFILLHENAHIRRWDNLWRVVSVVTACVHWFNPLAWVFLEKFFESTELACDEAVLTQCGESERKSYASALLSYAESRRKLITAFGGARLRVRIERILSYKRLSAFSAGCFAALAAAICYVLLTNAR